MSRKLAAAFLAATLVAGPGNAKTVQTETIPITPSGTAPTLQLPAEEIAVPEDTEEQPAPAPNEANADDSALPEVRYDTSDLPRPVARMHAQLKEAALSGDLERLRMVLESNEMPPTLSFAETGDPIAFLKESSGDGEGFEILAILADILEAGFVHVDEGTTQEMYVWPYFARYPLDRLTPDQKVELFRIVTAGDFADMQDFGAWTFYRLGIGPDGTLHYFVAGD